MLTNAQMRSCSTSSLNWINANILSRNYHDASSRFNVLMEGAKSHSDIGG